MSLWRKIMIALILGVATGLSFPKLVPILHPVGEMFLSLIQMLIVPLVFASVTMGVTSIHDPKKLGRVGGRTLLYYLCNTVIAITLAIILGKLFGLGTNLNLTLSNELTTIQTPSLSDLFLSLIPKNPLASMARGDILQVIIFGIFIGLAINMAGSKAQVLREWMESLADVMMKMTDIVMEFSPIGVFAIMVWVSGSFGSKVLLPLMKFLIVYYIACAVQLGVVFILAIRYLAKLKPLPFFKGMRDAALMAFSTCSSAASLPLSMESVQDNLGVSKNITGFVMPLGSTINMAGAAIYQAMSAIFISNAYGIHLDIVSLLTIVFTAVLSAIGAAGIPGSGLIMLTVVLSSVGLPLEGIALLAGIDRLREMGGTILNVLGDAIVALIIARQENEISLPTYYDEEEILWEGSEI